MSRVYRPYGWVAAALACVAAAVGCGGATGNSPVATSSPSPLSSQGPLAYLVYPTNAPTAASAQSPSFSATVPVTLVFAEQGINSTYQVMTSPTPPPVPSAFVSPCPSGQVCPVPSPVPAPTFGLNFNPTSLPNPLASPPIGGPFEYVTAQGPQLLQGTTYQISLVGCPSGGACTSPQTISLGALQTGCSALTGQPSVPVMALPSSGAAGVPSSIGSLIFLGTVNDGFGSTSVRLNTALGSSISVGAPTSAPSPLPSGLNPANAYFAVPIPTLSPETTYNVNLGVAVQTTVPPCATSSPTAAGTFTTQ